MPRSRKSNRSFSSIIRTIQKKTKTTFVRDMRGRHTKQSRLEKRKKILGSCPSSPTCRSCDCPLDLNITTDDGSALVCTQCGVVDDMPVFDTDQVTIPCIIGSPLYRHRYYFGERILQAKNEEPRLSDEELAILSFVFNLYADSGSARWMEAYFTKDHMSMICRHLINRYPKSFWVRRSERWFQYRTYICGETGIRLPVEVSKMLRILFDAYSYYFQVYLKNNGIKKMNITRLDMIILVLLFSLDESLLPKHGWYFLNPNLVNKTPSIHKNYKKVSEVCKLTNERILLEYHKTISPECYHWFRCGNRFTVPDLDDLVDGALGTYLGAIQYAKYCKDNRLGAHWFYTRKLA